MKTILLILITMMFQVQASSQHLKIPEGISYKKTDQLTNQQAIEKLEEELEEPRYSVFNNFFYCGPNIWERYVLKPSVGSIKKGNITFKVPFNKGFIDKKGKLIQSQADYQLIWDQLIIDFSDSEFNIRKLTSDELQEFWSIIFYDIEEPIFVLENKSHKVVVDLDSNLKIQFIDQLY